MLSALFIPDPGNGFPPGIVAGPFTVSGVMHLVWGAVGFLAMAAAAFVHSVWSRGIALRRPATASLLASLVILIGFFGGAALATSPIGISLLWLAVLAQFGWLALVSVQIYAWSPHPLGARSGQ